MPKRNDKNAEEIRPNQGKRFLKQTYNIYTMEGNNDLMKERMENDILFSRTVKAGKRVYYIDVKRDRHNEYYLAITESKKVREAGNEEMPPKFEKHKIFLYREDLERFTAALGAAVDYTMENSPEPARRHYHRDEHRTEDGAVAETLYLDSEGEKPLSESDFKFDVTF